MESCEKNLLPPLKWGIIVQESHKPDSVNSNGKSDSNTISKHLHAIIVFRSELDIHDPNFLDHLANGQHGNYAGVRSLKKSIAYLRKEDPNPLEFGERKGEGSPKQSVSKEVATMLMEGATNEELLKLYPGFLLMNSHKVNNFKNFLASKQPLGSGVSWVTYSGSQPETNEVIKWTQSNFFGPREFKQKQLYIWGPPDCGKTRFAMLINTKWRAYWVATLEDFFNDYQDEEYDCIVMDEFVTRDLPTLNTLLQGGIARLRTKGGQVVKKKNLPVLILSNGPPEKWFRNNLLLPAFLSRIKIIEVKEMLDLDNVLFE